MSWLLVVSIAGTIWSTPYLTYEACTQAQQEIVLKMPDAVVFCIRKD